MCKSSVRQKLHCSRVTKHTREERKGPRFVGPFALLLVTPQMWGELGKLPKSPGVSLSTGVGKHCLSRYLRASQPVQKERCPGSVKLSVKTC